MPSSHSADRIAIVGNLNWDLMLGPLGDWPGWGTEVLVEHIWRPGGVANAARPLAGLGRGVSLVATVGDDADGARLLDLLAGEGIDVRPVERQAGVRTGLSVGLVRRDGERTYMTSPGALAATTWSGLRARTEPLLDRCGAVLIMGYALHAALLGDGLAEFCAMLHGRGRLVAFDMMAHPAAGERVLASVGDALPGIDVLFCNEQEQAVLAALDLPGHLTLAVKLGPGGARVARRGRSVFRPALPCFPHDTGGAGDAWDAGFLDGLLRGESTGVAARWANAVACVAIEGNWRPTRAVVRERLASAAAPRHPLADDSR